MSLSVFCWLSSSVGSSLPWTHPYLSCSGRWEILSHRECSAVLQMSCCTYQKGTRWVIAFDLTPLLLHMHHGRRRILARFHQSCLVGLVFLTENVSFCLKYFIAQLLSRIRLIRVMKVHSLICRNLMKDILQTRTVTVSFDKHIEVPLTCLWPWWPRCSWHCCRTGRDSLEMWWRCLALSVDLHTLALQGETHN